MAGVVDLEKLLTEPPDVSCDYCAAQAGEWCTEQCESKNPAWPS